MAGTTAVVAVEGRKRAAWLLLAFDHLKSPEHRSQPLATRLLSIQPQPEYLQIVVIPG